MKNSLTDLHDYLFEQLERISDDELTKKELSQEVERTKAMTSLADTVISNGKLVLDVYKFKDDQINAEGRMPKFLDGNE